MVGTACHTIQTVRPESLPHSWFELQIGIKAQDGEAKPGFCLEEGPFTWRALRADSM